MLGPSRLLAAFAFLIGILLGASVCGGATLGARAVTPTETRQLSGSPSTYGP